MNYDEIIRALRTGIKFPDESGRHRWYYEKNEFRAILSKAADLLEFLQSRITELEARLADSQRRERAAVERLAKIDFLCEAFRYEGSTGLTDMFARDVMEISGSKEANNE